MVDLAPVQVEALASINVLPKLERWALVGATAIRCRLPMQRPTNDVDLVVATTGESLDTALTNAGWTRDQKKLQTWTRGRSFIDVIATSEEELLAGVARVGDGFKLSVIGFDLAFSTSEQIAIREDLVVPVPQLAALVLMKMVAWLDRPSERTKDLEDLIFILDNALPAIDDRRWGQDHPIGAAGLAYDDQSAFFVGWELGQLAQAQHLHWAQRFLDAFRSDDSTSFIQLVRASHYLGDDVESRVRSRMVAFERGIELGSQTVSAVVATVEAPMRTVAGARAWGSSQDKQLLIHDAIDQRSVIRFRYQGRSRIAEPHVLGIKDGRLQVLTWQIGGTSSSGNLPDWRRFFLSEMSDVELVDTKFAGARLTLERHSAFDLQIAVVH